MSFGSASGCGSNEPLRIRAVRCLAKQPETDFPQGQPRAGAAHPARPVVIGDLPPSPPLPGRPSVSQGFAGSAIVVVPFQFIRQGATTVQRLPLPILITLVAALPAPTGDTNVSLQLGTAYSSGLDQSLEGVNHPTRCGSLLYRDTVNSRPATTPTAQTRWRASGATTSASARGRSQAPPWAGPTTGSATYWNTYRRTSAATAGSSMGTRRMRPSSASSRS